jgi:hypothetical protein
MMGKQSGLLQKIQQRDHVREIIVREIVGQYDADTIIIALAEEFGFGYDRIMRLLRRWTEVRDTYEGALSPQKDPEGDVKQEHLDARIRAIMAKAGKEADFLSFAKRYPAIDDVDYNGRAWKT